MKLQAETDLSPPVVSVTEVDVDVMYRYNTTSPTPYDQIRPTLLNLPKETTSVSDSESIPSPSTSPPQARRHYGDSITSLGKASIMGEQHTWRIMTAWMTDTVKHSKQVVILFLRTTHVRGNTPVTCEWCEHADNQPRHSQQLNCQTVSVTVSCTVGSSEGNGFSEVTALLTCTGTCLTQVWRHHEIWQQVQKPALSL